MVCPLPDRTTRIINVVLLEIDPGLKDKRSTVSCETAALKNGERVHYKVLQVR